MGNTIGSSGRREVFLGRIIYVTLSLPKLFHIWLVKPNCESKPWWSHPAMLVKYAALVDFLAAHWWGRVLKIAVLDWIEPKNAEKPYNEYWSSWCSEAHHRKTKCNIWSFFVIFGQKWAFSYLKKGKKKIMMGQPTPRVKGKGNGKEKEDEREKVERKN